LQIIKAIESLNWLEDLAQTAKQPQEFTELSQNEESSKFSKLTEPLN
jgi:hypothetical protein